MSTDLIAYGVARMKQYGLVTGGDAQRRGILTMTDARWRTTFDFMASAGLAAPDTDYRKAYTLEFVNNIKVLP